MSFEANTRRKVIRMAAITKPTGGGTSPVVAIPPVGILSQLVLQCSVTIAGTLSGLNAAGVASVIRGVRLDLNTGISVVNVSGVGYNYAVRDFVNSGLDATPQNGARAAVSAATFNFDMVFPITVNIRDMVGALLLQGDVLTASLTIDWEADATVATGATVTGTVIPVLIVFEVPRDKADWPDFRIVHQWLEDKAVIAAAGDYPYNWPVGNVYLGTYHILLGTTWTAAKLMLQQSITLEDHTPATMRAILNQNVGRDFDLGSAPIAGSNQRVLWDFLGSDGLGEYGSVRDPIDSSILTALQSIVTVAGAGTLYTVRRQLVTLQ